MCLTGLLNRIKPQLPHPEEKPDLSRTVENTDIGWVWGSWFIGWDVPTEHQSYWHSYIVELVDDLHILDTNTMILIKVCEAIWSEEKRMQLDPQFANGGVLAHSIGGHGSYSLLTEDEKMVFTFSFDEALKTDKLLKLAYSQKPRMHKNDDLNNPEPNYVESHADCYRYLGQSMPESLKSFYNKLF